MGVNKKSSDFHYVHIPKDNSEVYNINLTYATTIRKKGTIINPLPKKHRKRPVITHDHLVCIIELLI